MEKSVSVIMAARNAGKYIRKALDSCINQTLRPLEIIAVDDASEDDTFDILMEYALKYPSLFVVIHNDKRLGAAKSRNIAIDMAKGKYIAFLDSDDYWHKEKLYKQMKVLKKTKAVLCATSRVIVTDEGCVTGKVIKTDDIITYKSLLHTNSITLSSVLAKAYPVKRFKMCHDELHEDYILWLRLLRRFKTAAGLNEPLTYSRMSKGGKSRNKLKSARMTYGVYRLMGFGTLRSMYYFFCYAINGIKKYGGVL